MISIKQKILIISFAALLLLTVAFSFAPVFSARADTVGTPMRFYDYLQSLGHYQYKIVDFLPFSNFYLYYAGSGTLSSLLPMRFYIDYDSAVLSFRDFNGSTDLVPIKSGVTYDWHSYTFNSSGVLSSAPAVQFTLDLKNWASDDYNYIFGVSFDFSNAPSSFTANFLCGDYSTFGYIESSITFNIIRVGSRIPRIGNFLALSDDEWYETSYFFDYIAAGNYYNNVYLPLFDSSTSDLYKLGYDVGKELGYNNGVSDGKILANSTLNKDSVSYTTGVADGKVQANNTVNKNSASYTAGMNAGIASAGNYTFASLIGAVFDGPVNAFRQFFNFEILGVNLTALLSSLFVAAVIITVIRLSLGG